MEKQQTTENETELNQEELDKIDTDLLGIDMLYKSRCVQAPGGSNVKIREIDPEEK